MKKPKKKSAAIAYLRTSSAANVGADKDSHKRQADAIQRFADQPGYEITDTQGIHGPDIGSKQTSVSGQTITDSNVAVDFAPADEFDWLYLPLLISGLISAIVVAVLAISYYRGGDEETFQQESPEPEADE